MKSSEDQGRHVTFGRFVKRARDRWLTANPDAGVREFCDHTGVSSPTLYRWINGDWKKDPDRENVDQFCAALGIPTSIPHRILGWGGEPPTREIAEPEVDSDVEAIGRGLADPEVPQDKKDYVRQTLRFLARFLSSRN